jgi:uncharacterized protein (TIGR02679 family)
MTSPVLDKPALRRLWDAVGERLQRNGLRPIGVVSLVDLDRDERHAIAGLIGRPVPLDRVSVDLALLDRRLRAAGTANGLLAATDTLRGPLVDRPGARAERRAAREAVWQSARAALADAGLAGAPWVEPWLEDVRRAGTLGRVDAGRGTATMLLAVTCIGQLPVRRNDPPCARGDLASLVVGDAHAFDDGTVLAAVVLRAVAAMTGLAYASTAAGRRELWRAAGVFTDSVSTTVLTIGLRSARGDSWLDDRTAAGWETHLTARDLQRVELRAPDDGQVFVCENPRVLEAAIERRSTCAALCTQGQPAVVVVTVVRILGELGMLRYHGDFDWPGITIANAMIGTHSCRPWRMSAVDYEQALSRLAPIVGELPVLEGPPVDAVWDPALASAMTRARRIVHEELVIEELLADMSLS